MADIRCIRYHESLRLMFVDPNRVQYPATLQDSGFHVYSDTYRFNGNLPGLHCEGPDHVTWDFVPSMHYWALASYLVPEKDQVHA